MPKPATLKRRAQRQRAKQRPLRGPDADRVSALLKSIYLPAILAQFEHTSSFLAHLEKDLPLVGSTLQIPLTYRPRV